MPGIGASANRKIWRRPGYLELELAPHGAGEILEAVGDLEKGTLDADDIGPVPAGEIWLGRRPDLQPVDADAARHRRVARDRRRDRPVIGPVAGEIDDPRGRQ